MEERINDARKNPSTQAAKHKEQRTNPAILTNKHKTQQTKNKLDFNEEQRCKPSNPGANSDQTLAKASVTNPSKEPAHSTLLIRKGEDKLKSFFTVAGMDDALFNPRRDDNGRDPNTQSIKLEIKRLRSHNPIRVRDPTHWCRHMIIEPTMLIIRDHQKGFIPLWASPQCLIHLLHKHLTIVHIM
ncbi:hypothetical protein CFP56_031139 [Quercus suber]|uniref:Uncharacterized protein n=1 Tax=Quercus suber TaxID=58331 RepID=A0AAW0JKR6_QUESU